MLLPFRKMVLILLTTFSGCALTLGLCASGINVLFSSASVGLLFACLAMIFGMQACSEGAFAGTFAGMTSLDLLGYSHAAPLCAEFLLNAALLSLAVAVSFCTVEHLEGRHRSRLFKGYGGRMGFISFFAVILFQTISFHIHDIGFIKPENYKFAVSFGESLAVLSSLSGSLICALMNRRNDESHRINHKIAATCFCALTGGLILFIIPRYGPGLARAYYMGLFVGMSSSVCLKSWREFMAAGLLAGLLFIITGQLCQGIGGTLGFTAFVSVVLVSAAARSARLKEYMLFRTPI